MSYTNEKKVALVAKMLEKRFPGVWEEFIQEPAKREFTNFDGCLISEVVGGVFDWSVTMSGRHYWEAVRSEAARIEETLVN